MQFLISLLAFLVVITVLVAVHEFGHYWVAKRVGIKVERFSIGFGKPFYTKFFKGNETEFALAPFPFGGYVKMLDTRIDENVPTEDIPRAYNSKSPWQRIAVLLAGPFANLLFAILVFWLLFVFGVSAYRPLVSPLSDSVAQKVGLQAGDEVFAVNDRAVNSFEEFVTQLYGEILSLANSEQANSERGQVKLTVLRNGSEQNLHLPITAEMTRLEQPEKLLSELGISNWQPPLKPVIEKVSANSAASKVGLQAGDEIVSLDGVKIDNWAQLVSLIQSNPSKVMRVTYFRNAVLRTDKIKIGEHASGEQSLGIIGVSVAVPENYGAQLQTRQQYGIFASLEKAASKTWDMSVLSLKMFKEMLQGNVSLKNLSGPVSIAEQAGYSVQSGLDRYVAFFALISIALGIVNLMPIPMLDGGQIVLNVTELVKGSPVSERSELVYQQFGFVCIMLMMGLAVFNDVERLLN